ncbi:hypothetical protein ACTU45_33810 [Streptomyces sp. 24-1644]|uniref:hypothetical protein n=1 Tax=Streptomyces sp. 24-1644 TaxID=3457315 RepID=UPI003FA6EF22
MESDPWNPATGAPLPVVWCWPPGARPALLVRTAGQWRYAPVQTRQDYADGRHVYLVAVNLDGATTVTVRRYAWPQPGLRVAPGSPVQPTRSR